MNELSTAHSLAEETGKDPRSVELTLNREGLEPVARLVGKTRQPFLWNREEAKRVITQALIEGSKKNNK